MRPSRVVLASLVSAGIVASVNRAHAITLPDNSSCNTTSSNGCFKITNSNTGSAAKAVTGTASGTGVGVTGTASTTGWGVMGQTSDGRGVYGSASGNGSTATGVYGASTGTGANAIGVFGNAAGTSTGSAKGVSGTSTWGTGVHGVSTNRTGVFGQSSGGNIWSGVFGLATTNTGASGVMGVSTGSEALMGVVGMRVQSYDLNNGPGPEWTSGNAVRGIGGQYAVEGTTGGEAGVRGIGTDAGVIGLTATGAGVTGTSSSGPGTSGTSDDGSGALGTSTFGTGVDGISISGPGVRASNNVTTTSGAAAVIATPGSTTAFAFWGDGGIHISGNTAEKPGGGMWSATASDRRVKKDVKDFERGISELMRVRPVQFKYNGLGGTDDNGKEYVGLIAQELEQVLPNMVSSRNRKLQKGDAADTAIKTVDPSDFTYLLINAVKQQQRIIAKQDERIANLERGSAPLASSMFSGSLGGLAALALLPIGMFLARRRRNQT